MIEEMANSWIVYPWIEQGLFRDVFLAFLIGQWLRRRDPRNWPGLRAFFNLNRFCHCPRQKVRLRWILIRCNRAFIIFFTNWQAGQTWGFIALFW